MKPLLDVRTAAALIGCHAHSLYRMARLHLVPHVRVPGAGIKFVEEDIERWIEELKDQPGNGREKNNHGLAENKNRSRVLFDRNLSEHSKRNKLT